MNEQALEKIRLGLQFSESGRALIAAGAEEIGDRNTVFLAEHATEAGMTATELREYARRNDLETIGEIMARELPNILGKGEEH